jgi:hypothetical protein
MKLLRIGNSMISPECISHVWFNPCSSEVKVYLFCSNAPVEVVGSCVSECGSRIKKIDVAELTFTGEEAEALKRYFADHENG